MSDRDDHHRTEALDDADDLRLGELDRAALLGITSGADHNNADPWGPAPADLEPWEPIYIKHGRKGQ